MATYRVTFEVEMPDDAPEDQVQEFVEFEICARASLRVCCESLQNKDLHSCDVSNVWVSKVLAQC